MNMARHRSLMATIPALLALATACRAGAYDFFELSRYPVEGKPRPWVELYKVKQAGNGDPQAYDRRTVQWWPRKGVDFTELRDGMIEREWTLAASALDPDCEARVLGELLAPLCEVAPSLETEPLTVEAPSLECVDGILRELA